MPRFRARPAPTTAAAPSRRRRRSPARRKAPIDRGSTAPAPPEPARPAAGRACATRIAADGRAAAARTSRTARSGSRRRRAPDSGARCRRARRRHSRGSCAPRNRPPCPAKGPADHRKTAPQLRGVRRAAAQSPRSRRRAASAPRASPSRRANDVRAHQPKNPSIWPCFPRCRPSPKNPRRPLGGICRHSTTSPADTKPLVAEA